MTTTPNRNTTILMNPEVAQVIMNYGGNVSIDRPTCDLLSATWDGLPVVLLPEIPKHPMKWVFPKEKFWIYEPSDEAWCRTLGLGHEEEDTSQYVVWNLPRMNFEIGKLACTPELEPVPINDSVVNRVRHQIDRDIVTSLVNRLNPVPTRTFGLLGNITS